MVVGCNRRLIALFGCARRGCRQDTFKQQHRRSEHTVTRVVNVFPDRYYIELQRTGREYEEEYIDAAVTLAHQYDVPVVATNDVRF